LQRYDGPTLVWRRSDYQDANAELSEILRGRHALDQEEVCWSILSIAQDEVREAETEFIRARLAWPGAPFNKAARDYRERHS
jgi:hypothetical protein